MAQKGDWGNMMIITLSSTDEPRNKLWCVHYRKSDKHCCEQNLKCMGSSHCKYYKKKHGVGPIQEHYVPVHVEHVIIPPEENAPPTTKVQKPIPGRHPSFGEKMVGKVVMTKGRFGKIHIGEVIAEDRYTFTVERDSGEVKKYMRKDVLRANSVWVLDNYEEYICHFK